MNYWNWILYIGASFIALRSLLSLMDQHKEKYKQELIQQHQAEVAAAESVQTEAEEAASEEQATAA